MATTAPAAPCAALGRCIRARCKGERAEPLEGKAIAAHVAESDDSFQGVLLKSDKMGQASEREGGMFCFANLTPSKRCQRTGTSFLVLPLFPSSFCL